MGMFFTFASIADAGIGSNPESLYQSAPAGSPLGQSFAANSSLAVVVMLICIISIVIGFIVRQTWKQNQARRSWMTKKRTVQRIIKALEEEVTNKDESDYSVRVFKIALPLYESFLLDYETSLLDFKANKENRKGEDPISLWNMALKTAQNVIHLQGAYK